MSAPLSGALFLDGRLLISENPVSRRDSSRVNYETARFTQHNDPMRPGEGPDAAASYRVFRVPLSSEPLSKAKRNTPSTVYSVWPVLRFRREIFFSELKNIGRSLRAYARFAPINAPYALARSNFYGSEYIYIALNCCNDRESITPHTLLDSRTRE